MRQKHLGGGATVVNKSERIRELFARMNGATIEQLAKKAIRAGVFTQEDADAQLLRYAKLKCKSVINQDDEQGLPFAGPVEGPDENPVWKQREFWELDHYRRYVGRLKDHRDAVAEKIGLLDTECRTRFGHGAA